MFLLWSASAHAACQLAQGMGVDLIEVRIQATGNPRGCQQVFLDAPQISEIRAWVAYPTGGRRKLPREYMALTEGGIWELIAPELVEGGELLIQGHIDATLVEAPAITVAFSRPTISYQALDRLDQSWELVTNPKHPGWSFADPKQGHTYIDATWQTLPGAAAERYPIPPDIEVSGEGFLARSGFLLSTGDRTHATYTLPGTPPIGALTLPPGSLTLLGPISWVFELPADASQEPVENGVKLVLPSGGEVQFRAQRIGDTDIIPDLATFMAGMTERFRVASLPEPAVPNWLRTETDTTLLFTTIFNLVQEAPELALPGRDLAHPRPLNQAWRSGFASEVEKGLILHRLLGQERFAAFWALTGENASMTTLTGFDAVVVKTDWGWLDPGCGVCGIGEIATNHIGKPAIFSDGKTESLPNDWGKIEQQLTLNGTTFDLDVTLSGEAAVWLREQLFNFDKAAWAGRAAEILGAAGAQVLIWKDADSWGAPIQARFRLERVPEVIVWPPGSGQPIPHR